MRRFLVFWILSLFSCFGCQPVPPDVYAQCHEVILCAESQCGNGVKEPGEECDDGDRSSTGTERCTRFCLLVDRDCITPSVCNNGLLELGEECDDGNAIDDDGCSTGCALCGNGIVTPPENCDDGNLSDGDGCDQFCRF